MSRCRCALVLVFLIGCARPAPAPRAATAPAAAEPAPEEYAHPHAHHRFDDAAHWAVRFEAKDRDEWQKPEAVIAALALEPGMKVADIGAATGYFPVRIAPLVPEGRVWGVDIEPAMVRYLNARARRESLPNLFSILAAVDDPLLPEPVDRVLVVDTIHHIADRTAYFRRVSDYLTPGGQVVIVDFEMGEIPVGPPDEAKLPPDKVVAELEAAGYSLVRRDEELLPYQYVLVFARSTRA